METCDKCGLAVAAEWVAFHKVVVEYRLALCGHHKSEYGAAMVNNWELIRVKDLVKK